MITVFTAGFVSVGDFVCCVAGDSVLTKDGKVVRKHIRVSYGDRCGDSSFVLTAFVPVSATAENPAPSFLLI